MTTSRPPEFPPPSGTLPSSTVPSLRNATNSDLPWLLRTLPWITVAMIRPEAITPRAMQFAVIPNGFLDRIPMAAASPLQQTAYLLLAFRRFGAAGLARIRKVPPSGLSISNELAFRTRSLSLRNPNVLGSKSDAMLASCFPTMPRGIQPSSLSICSITLLRIAVASEGS
jgi:hypothetical protein